MLRKIPTMFKMPVFFLLSCLFIMKNSVISHQRQ